MSGDDKSSFVKRSKFNENISAAGTIVEKIVGNIVAKILAAFDSILIEELKFNVFLHFHSFPIAIESFLLSIFRFSHRLY